MQGGGGKMLVLVIHVFWHNLIQSEHIKGGWQIKFSFILMIKQKQHGRHCEKLGILVLGMVVNHW